MAGWSNTMKNSRMLRLGERNNREKKREMTEIRRKK
jgi:hypothetical protein